MCAQAVVAAEASDVWLHTHSETTRGDAEGEDEESKVSVMSVMSVTVDDYLVDDKVLDNMTDEEVTLQPSREIRSGNESAVFLLTYPLPLPVPSAIFPALQRQR